jgi:hypothetical protein
MLTESVEKTNHGQNLMTKRAIWSAIMMSACAFGVAGCDGQSEETTPAGVFDNYEAAADNLDSMANKAMAESPTPNLSLPRYESREGNSYLYVAAVSEEERKRGKSAGDVVIFQYLGMRDGVHRLASLDDAGARIALSECASPCKVIKRTMRSGAVDRLGFNPESIIGSAFLDAINGHLKAVPDPPPAAASSEKEALAMATIPAPFHGEWTEDLTACGRGSNESRLRIHAHRLQFYESEAAVRSVHVDSARSITAQASFTGEGETWDKSITMVLSQSGSELSIEGLTRLRCP